MYKNFTIKNFDEVSETNNLSKVEYKSLFRVLADKKLKLRDVQILLCWDSGIGQNAFVVDKTNNIIEDITDYHSW